SFITGELREIGKRPAVLLQGGWLQNRPAYYMISLNGLGTLWPEPEELQLELPSVGRLGLSVRDNLPLLLCGGVDLQAFAAGDVVGSEWSPLGEAGVVGYLNATSLVSGRTAVLQGPLNYVLLAEDPQGEAWLHK